MRIQELLEGKYVDYNDFVKQSGDKREIDFDLTEDLIHFMHNDDDVYRRHLYPSITKCIDSIHGKKSTNLKVFEPAVKHSYKLYIEKFPIRELPTELSNKMMERICNKLHNDTLKDIKDGVYKD
jgi:hypothetical protein